MSSGEEQKFVQHAPPTELYDLTRNITSFAMPARSVGVSVQRIRGGLPPRALRIVQEYGRCASWRANQPRRAGQRCRFVSVSFPSRIRAIERGVATRLSGPAARRTSNGIADRHETSSFGNSIDRRLSGSEPLCSDLSQMRRSLPTRLQTVDALKPGAERGIPERTEARA